MPDLLTDLLQRIDQKHALHAELDRYYAGDTRLSYLSPEARTALGNRLQRVAVNVPRLLVDSMAERLRVTGFDGADVWDEWLNSDLDQMAPVAHREALTLGTSFVVVWSNGDGPNVSIESAHQMSVVTDPGTRRVVAAVKRWETDTTTEATLFEADKVTRLRANSTGATTTGFRTIETLDNPLGVVPVVRLRNGSRLLDDGESEMRDVLSLSDALVKLTTDLLVASEYGARPRRWATGIELEENDAGEAENPIPESNRVMVSENPDARFGQLPGFDLAGYENAVGVIMRQISAVSGLPEHMLGIGGDNPTSADSIRASEASLTARAEAKQAQFGRQWEQVARLIVAVRDGVDPRSVNVRVRWADAATRSTGQEADAVTKLHSAGLLPVTTALERLGYSQDDIDQVRTARRAESLDTAGVDLAAVLP